MAERRGKDLAGGDHVAGAGAPASPDELVERRERRLLEAARRGNEDAFAALIEPLRHQLQAHCRRILRSPHDAEDALQESLLRAWRGLPRFEGRSSLRSWLYRIATNVCLSMIRVRPERAAAPNEEQPSDDADSSPADRYEQRETLELAVAAAHQRLTPNQRATLILSEALEFTSPEAAELLGTTTASVNSALQRARRNLADRSPERQHQPSPRVLGDQRLREIVEEYVRAIEAGDVPAVATMLVHSDGSVEPRLPAPETAPPA